MNHKLLEICKKNGLKVDEFRTHQQSWIERSCVLLLLYFFSRTFNDLEIYGCNEPHYVLDLFLGFGRNLATFIWINY